MKEIDIIKHARSYMAQLSERVNPITKEKYSDNSDMNNERLLKCFAFVTEILDRVILEEENNKNSNNDGDAPDNNDANIKTDGFKNADADSESSFFKNSLVPEEVEGEDVVKTLVEKGVLKIGISKSGTEVKK